MNLEEITRLLPSIQTPAYVFDKRVFEQNLHDFLTAFRSRYSNAHLGYSYKTNYLPYVCRTIQKEGCYAEVVSPYEYQYAMSIGVPGSRVIYNGVCKTRDSIAAAGQNGSIINADSVDDLAKIIDVCRCIDRPPIIGVRLNLDLGNGVASRFGLSPDSSDFERLLSIARADGVRISGIHCHVSKARGLEMWKKRAQMMIEYAKRIPGCSFIDLGSNFFGRMPHQLAKQFGERIPSFDDYADVICDEFRKAYPEEKMMLFLEPGTALVANAMCLVSSVVSTKRSGAVRYAFLDCCKYDLGFVGASKNVPVANLSHPEPYGKEYVLTGCTCIEDDVLCKKYTGTLFAGDVLAFDNVGAYSNNLSAGFIKATLPVYLFDGERVIEVEE